MTRWTLPLVILGVVIGVSIAYAVAYIMPDDDPCTAWHGTWRYFENGISVCVDPTGRVIR